MKQKPEKPCQQEVLDASFFRSKDDQQKGADYGAKVPILVPTNLPLAGKIFIDLPRNWLLAN